MYVYKCTQTSIQPLGPQMDLVLQKVGGFKGESEDEAEMNETGEALGMMLIMEVWENRKNNKSKE